MAPLEPPATVSSMIDRCKLSCLNSVAKARRTASVERDTKNVMIDDQITPFPSHMSADVISILWRMICMSLLERRASNTAELARVEQIYVDGKGGVEHEVKRFKVQHDSGQGPPM